MKSLLPILAPALLAPLALYAPAEPARQAQEAESGPRSLLAAVPEDALLFVSVSDMTGLRAAAESNAWGRMLRDTEFAPLWEWLETEIQSEMAQDQADPEELQLFLDSLQGSAAFFVSGTDFERPDLGFVFDSAGGRASFEELLAKTDSGDDSGKSYEDYGGTTLGISSEDETLNAMFELDGLYCMAAADSREVLLELAHGMIDRLRGSGETSIETSPLLAAARAGSPPGRIELFADVQRFTAEMQKEEALDEEVQRVFDLIGLTRLSWLHGTMDLGEGEELDWHLRLALPSEGYLNDWFGLFGPLPRQLAALGPASATQAAFYNVDLFAIYESAWDLFADLDPEAYEEARAALENGLQSVGDLDLEGDFLAQITGEVASFSVPIPEEEFAAFNQMMGMAGAEGIPEELRVGPVYVIGLEDASAVELFIEDALSSVGLMFGLSAASIESEDFQGFAVQSLELPMGFSLHWCFTDDYVAGSMFPSALRAVLALSGKEDAPSLLTNKLFAPHIEQHAQASMLGLAPSASLVRGLLTGLGWINNMAPALAPDAAWDNAGGGEPTAWPFAGVELPDASLADRYLAGTFIFKLECNDSSVEMALMTR